MVFKTNGKLWTYSGITDGYSMYKVANFHACHKNGAKVGVLTGNPKLVKMFKVQSPTILILMFIIFVFHDCESVGKP